MGEGIFAFSQHRSIQVNNNCNKSWCNWIWIKNHCWSIDAKCKMGDLDVRWAVPPKAMVVVDPAPPEEVKVEVVDGPPWEIELVNQLLAPPCV